MPDIFHHDETRDLVDRRSPSYLTKGSTPAEMWALSAIILVGAFFISPGFFTVDEAIYHIGARAFAEGGALGIDRNGYVQFHSDALKLLLLIEGPQGLTPQYPAGTALLAAPLVPVVGSRAFILLNAVAAVLTLFTVRKICLSQFKSELVARTAVALLMLGTFWAEYALGIWPHMLSTYFAVQAYWFALRHLDSDGDGYRDALLSGLFAGAGMLIRLDAALAVPAIGLIMAVFTPRFMRSSIWFGTGVLPSLVLASWFNYLKFGSPNPFSYGRSVGNTNLLAHTPLLAALCLGFGAILLLRKYGWRVDRRVTIAALVVVGGAVLVFPATNAWLLRLWNGFLALVVDMRHVEDGRVGVQPGPEETRLFWNLAKKALGQSMPWIGLAAMLLTRGVDKDERRVVGMLLIFVATMTMPFILLSWHGGLGSNMRYFLPVLPALCILCAMLLSDLWTAVSNALVLAVAGAWTAIALCVGWTLLHPLGYLGVQQILSTYVFVATAMAAIAAGISWRFTQASHKLVIALFGGGLFMSMASAASDFRMAQIRRAQSFSISESLTALPAKSLVITFPEWAVARIPGNGSILATRNPETKLADPQLIVDALGAGYRVFLDSYEFNAARDVPPGVQAFPTSHRYPDGRWIELRQIEPIADRSSTRGAYSIPSLGIETELATGDVI